MAYNNIKSTTNETDVSSTPANQTIGIADNPTIPGTAAMIVTTGTTAQEPAATNGMVRYDSTTNKLRAVEAGAWTDVIGGGGSLLSVQVFTASGTWTKPAGINQVVVEVQGAGGGGGGADETSGNNVSAGGGGGGGYSKEFITSGLGATETVTVGTGGAGGLNTGTNGSSGGNSSFGAFCTGNGGSGGTGNTDDGTMVNGGAGGTGTGGTINISGQSGGSSLASRIASSTTLEGFKSGDGGNSILGTGGKSPTNPSISKSPNGNLYGGGGSGALSTDTSGAEGGDGAAGIVIVWEYS